MSKFDNPLRRLWAAAIANRMAKNMNRDLVRAPKGAKRNKYKPHQGGQECLRRLAAGRFQGWVNHSRYFAQVKP